MDVCLSFSRVPLERLGASAHAARSGSCRPERSEGTTAAPRPFTSFRAAASGRPVLFTPPGHQNPGFLTRPRHARGNDNKDRTGVEAASLYCAGLNRYSEEVEMTSIRLAFHLSKFSFFSSAMKRGSERSESNILSIFSKPHNSEWAA